MRLVAVFLFLVLVSGTASAQPLAAAPDSSLQLYVISQPLEQPAPPVAMVEDRVIEEYIMRLVFDPTYVVGSLKDAAASDPVWKDWEDYYFNREEYRAKLETFLRQYWSVGPWWWQSEAKVEIVDELDRGGPIHFRVDYPLVDFRNDLEYEITKDEVGQTKLGFTGKFHSQRFGYLLASGIQLIIIAILAIATIFIAKVCWHVFNLLVTEVANALTNGNGNNVWVWRFAACIVGAALLGIIFVVSAFI